MTTETEDSKPIETRIARTVEQAVAGRPGDPQEISRHIIQNFCSIKEPKTEILMQYIRMTGPGGSGGGISRKPGNITLNWRRLFESLPGFVFPTAAASANPWLIPFAALVIWREIWKQAAAEISPRHAIALWCMWEGRDGRQRIQSDQAFMLVNQRLQELQMPKMESKEYEQIIDALLELDCIELDAGEIWLCEWIKKPL